jgi:ankyrin repeat protein
MQDGSTPAGIASLKGHTETLALLLANKADINVASKVQQFKIFKYINRLTTSCKSKALTFTYNERF